MRAGDLKSSAKRERTPQYVSPVALCQRLNRECREIGIARCEVEPELDWSGALRCVHLKSSRNPAAKRNRAARAPRCIVRSRLSGVYCERLRALVHHSKFKWLMSALGQKQTLGKVRLMSALPPKADIGWHSPNVRHAMAAILHPSAVHESCTACCARAASGHAPAAPPTSVMNSRRFIRSRRRLRVHQVAHRCRVLAPCDG